MKLTHKFANTQSDLESSQIDNGDVVFVKEDQSIITKINDQTIDFSNITAWNDLEDTMSAFGIALTGEFDSSGAKLAHIDAKFNEVNSLDQEFFDSNPIFNFETVEDNGNTMVKVPLCYWWKGIIPTGKYQGKWGMLVSTRAKTINGKVMKPNYVAFMNTDGELQNSFAIGAYRGRLKDNKWMSINEGNPTGNYTFEETKNYCKANGGSYSLLTFQAWHDICSRAVIERKSFMITSTDAARKTLSDITGYRGIVDAFYSYNDSVFAEWMDGVQPKPLTATTDLRVIQTFSNDGSRTYVDAYTTAEGKNYSSPYPTEFLSNEYMDNLLFGKPETNSETRPATDVNDIIPDGQYTYGYSGYSSLGSMHLNSTLPANGPFHCNLANGTVSKYTPIGGRIAAFL